MRGKPRVALLGALATAILGAGTYLAYDYYVERRTAEAAAEAARQAVAQQARHQQAQREAQAQLLRSLKDPGPSRWLQQRLAPLWSALAKSNARILIVPPSNPEDNPGLDVTARIAFARALSDSLGSGTQAPVPDPGFVLAAVGEPRTIDERELSRLLAQTPTESLVTGAITLEPARIALVLRRTDIRTKRQTSYETRVDIGNLARPEQSLEGIASKAMRELGFETRPTEKVSVKVAPALALPTSPLAATAGPFDPVTGIWMQQLLATLHSALYLADPRAQERMFERSLWSLSQIDADSADRAVLEARALSHLGRREAALTVLEGAPRGPEAVALAAYFNANLPEFKKAVGYIRRPVARLIGELELLSVREAAGDMTRESRRAELKRIAAKLPEPWQVLVGLYVLSFDPWDYPSPVLVKQVLERDFPLPDSRIEDIVLGKAALGASPLDPKLDAELTLSPLVHVQKWRERHPDELCCVRAVERASRPALADYLDLLENSADALLLGHLHYLRVVQGNRDQTLAAIKLYDELLFVGSHPGVLLQKGLAYEPANRVPRNAWNQDEVFDAARKIKAWTPYQSLASAWATNNWRRALPQVAVARGYRGAFIDLLRPVTALPPAADMPPRAVFLSELPSGALDPVSMRIDKELLRKGCAITVHDFDPCRGYAQFVRAGGQEAERQQVDDLLRGRFAGYSDAAMVKVAHLRDLGRIADAESVLRDAIKTSSSAQLYSALGKLLSNEGKFDEAGRVYASLPALKRPGDNTVALSNYLNEAADRLLVRGAGTPASRLVETAATYQDGSAANLRSRARVALWRKDGELALERLRTMYQRYPSVETLGQIASLLFALDDRDAAWSAVKSGVASVPEFALLAPAVVGLRQARASAPDMLAWVESSGTKSYVWTATTAFRVFALDRSPSTFDAFFEAEGPLRLKDPNNYMHGGAVTRTPHGDVFGQAVQSTSEDNALALRATVNGYRELLRANYAAAADALSPLLEQFDRTGVPQGFEGPDNFWSMLPYTAYALARSGRRAQAANLLERFDEQRQRAAGRQQIRVNKAPDFEAHLVNAILAATASDHARGLKELRLAQASMREGGQTRLIPQAYELAEIAEWLSRDTKNPAYVAVGVELARAYQLYEPWNAWSYAYEAAHGRDSASRLRAAGVALWLDPESRRLRSLPESLQAQARQSLRRNPPFRKPGAGKPESKA